MKKLTTTVVMALLCPFLSAQQPTIKPLTIGDTVPDIIINNIANYKSTTISLASLRGKPLIIDFWGQYCTPCITTIGKLDSLCKASGNAFEVITVSDHTTKKELYKTLRKYSQTKNLQLPVVLGSKELKQWFPHKIISHLVWIGGDGTIKAITGGDEVTPQHIKKFISGQPLHWKMKTDILNFNLRIPLLEYTGAYSNAPEQLYYSAFFSYIPDINPPNWHPVIDSLKGTLTISVFNQPLLNYCSFLLDKPNAFGTDNYILQVKDSTRYVRGSTINKSEWNKLNTYCYTICLPLNTKESVRKRIIQNDIQNWLLSIGIIAEKVDNIPGSPIKITEL